MNSEGLPKPELLSTLIQELEGTIQWLSESRTPPSAQAARERFQTLREAAAFTGATAIEGWLAELENNPFDPEESGAKLTRLAQASRMLAEPTINRELDWLGQNSNLCRALEDVAKGLAAGSERLGQFSSLVERCVTTLNERERSELSAKLSQKLYEEIRLQRIACRRLLASIEVLRRWAREFSEDWQGLERVSLSPRLIELRSWLQRQAEQRKRTFTWQINDIVVYRDHLEPLTIILHELCGKISIGALTPSEPIKINAESHGYLATISIEFDTPNQRPPALLSEAAARALTTVRGRVVFQPLGHSYRLLLQFVNSGQSEEVVPVQSQAGLVFLPVWMVKEIDSPVPDSDSPWLPIALPKSSHNSPAEIEGAGALIEIGSFKAFLPCRAAGMPLRALVDPALINDPAWVQGRIRVRNVPHPVVCPLPFIPVEKGSRQIFPIDSRQRKTERGSK